MKKIAVVDFGGQYAHLIARRIRGLGVFAEIFSPFDPSLAGNCSNDANDSIAGVVLSGGPGCAPLEDKSSLGFDLDSLKVPLLGICYGHQLIATLSGGKVSSGGKREYGLARIKLEKNASLFEKIETRSLDVWMSHGDHVESLPAGFKITATSASTWSNSTPTGAGSAPPESNPQGVARAGIAAFESIDKPIFGVQFHPEVTHTRHGLEMLDRFLELKNSSCFSRAASIRSSRSFCA
jgi:GMP synthase (glutamine-hydrolysing)